MKDGKNLCCQPTPGPGMCRDVRLSPQSSEPSGSAHWGSPSLCFPHIPWVLLCCPSPVHRVSSYHPNSQPKPQISVSPGLITLPVLLVIHPRAAQPCLCLPRCTGAPELPKQSLFHENCFIQHLRRAAAAGRGQVYTDACVSGLASRCLLALHRPPSH